MSDDQQQPPAENNEPTAAQEGAPAEATPPAPAPQGGGAQIPGADKKILAGILGIVFNGLGIHKFVLGYQKEGIIMLVSTIVGYVLGIVGSMVVIGCVFFLIPMATCIIGLIEGIMYLTKSDQEFVDTYITNKKPWF